jgi:uncharacterized membrane protein YgcG
LYTAINSTVMDWRIALHVHRRIRWIGWTLALHLLVSLQPAKATTSLSFLSSPYSYIGLGETLNASLDDGFEISVSGDPSITLGFTIARPWMPDGVNRYWNLYVAAPQGETLAVGSYANATRWPFQLATAPGLDFSGNHRGNNRLTGSFDILELSYSVEGISSVAIDFLQYDEEGLNGWIKGALRYNSAISVALTPEPIIVDPPLDPGTDPSDELLPSPGEQTWPDTSNSGSFSSGSSSSGSSSSGSFSSGGFSSELVIPVFTELTPFHGTPVPTPGPLPIAGAVAGWHSARRLRRRSQARRQHPARSSANGQSRR